MLVKKLYNVRKYGTVIKQRTDYLLLGIILIYRKEVVLR